MKTKTIKWLSRMAMMLLMTMLTTATAWADDVNLTENTDETEGTAERWFVNIPKTGENKLTLTDASIIFFKVYDNGGGPQNPYDNIDELFATYTNYARLERVKTINLGTMYELTYIIDLKDPVKEKEFIDALRCRNGNLTVIVTSVLRNKDDL